jgi:hypothetical protein
MSACVAPAGTGGRRGVNTARHVENCRSHAFSNMRLILTAGTTSCRSSAARWRLPPARSSAGPPQSPKRRLRASARAGPTSTSNPASSSGRERSARFAPLERTWRSICWHRCCRCRRRGGPRRQTLWSGTRILRGWRTDPRSRRPRTSTRCVADLPPPAVSELGVYPSYGAIGDLRDVSTGTHPP